MGSASERVYLREVTSGRYRLTKLLQTRRELPRTWSGHTDYDGVKDGYLESDPSKDSATEWVLSPEDDPLRTQTLQVHYKRLTPGGSNTGHGHQNEAAFHIISGAGYEIHDGQRYDWKTGDYVFVHTDSVHRHFNASQSEPADTLVIKAKSTWLAMGMFQQGRIEPWSDPEGRYGDRVDWSELWTPGQQDRRKVVTPRDDEWTTTPDGIVRTICSPQTNDVRSNSVDIYEQRIPPGSRSSRHWHMGDEYLYVKSGSGRTLQWDVEMELHDRYYARIAQEPVVAEFARDSHVYVPPNTVHLFENSGDGDLVLISASNRVFRTLGYDRVKVLDPAPEHTA